MNTQFFQHELAILSNGDKVRGLLTANEIPLQNAWWLASSVFPHHPMCQTFPPGKEIISEAFQTCGCDLWCLCVPIYPQPHMEQGRQGSQIVHFFTIYLIQIVITCGD